MPTCGSAGCSCRRPDYGSARTNRDTDAFRLGQAETLRRLQKIPGLTITYEGGYTWFQMGEYKAPGVILHGAVSIQTDFRNRRSEKRTLVPIRKMRPQYQGYGLAQAIKTNYVEYVMDSMQRIHDA